LSQCGDFKATKKGADGVGVKLFLDNHPFATTKTHWGDFSFFDINPKLGFYHVKLFDVEEWCSMWKNLTKPNPFEPKPVNITGYVNQDECLVRVV